MKPQTNIHQPNIHSSAIIDPSAKIGHNVVVGPYSRIGPDAIIGSGCQIRSHAVIEYTELGDGCQVYPFASLGLPPQHTQYKGEKTKVITGKNCTFREGVTVHRGTSFDQGITRIGDNGFFMAYSHIAHDCKVGNNVIMANGALLAGHVELGDNCFISATAGIHQYVRIGKGVMVSGGAMVSLDVAPFCIAQGDRAKIRGLNIIGMRRMGMSKISMNMIKNAFKIVFLHGLTLEDALKDPALNVSDPYVTIFKEFLFKKKRGFCRPSSPKVKETEAEEVAP